MIEKIGNSNVMVDVSLNRITFLDARFYQTEDGGFVPSVTTILDAYPKGPEYYAWLKKVGEDSDTIRDEAGRRGSVVHNLTERYDNGEEVCMMNDEGHISYKIAEWKYFERYVEFRRRFSFAIHHTEINLISESLGFAGTLDRVIELNGERILLDIKTANSIYPSYWLQLAAYEQLLLNECSETVDKVGILWLNAKTRTDGTKGAIQGTGWQLITRDNTERDYQLFKATHALWLAENDTLKPNQISYSLKHKYNGIKQK
jgi:hypothetical protein